MAQIAVAFVGFSGIVATFSRQPGRWNIVAQSMNAAAWPYQPQRAVYIFGVLYMLVMAGALFLRLVSVRPPSD